MGRMISSMGMRDPVTIREARPHSIWYQISKGLARASSGKAARASSAKFFIYRLRFAIGLRMARPD